jgi:FemAB-related protein (PEP-CTERM system-associated)
MRPLTDGTGPAAAAPSNLASPAPTTGTFEISRAAESDRAAWDDFIARTPGGSFYHRFGWKGLVEREFGHHTEYLVARRAGEIAGILPLVYLESRLFGNILCSVPFLNYGGPLASDAATASALAEHATALTRTLGADYLELRCAAPLETAMPVNLRKISMTVPLMADPDALFNSFTSKHRTNIRRAQKNDLDVVSGGAELLDTFYALLETSWRSLGTPLYAKRYFQAICTEFGDLVRIFVCRHKGTPIAVTFNGHGNGVVEGMWAGSPFEFRHLQPNYVLYWEMMRDACARGFKQFHLGRSTSESGAEQFKSKWMAETRQLYWYFHKPDGGPMPELNPDNPKYRLAIAAWQRLPLWATRTIGPRLARSIP